MKTPSVPLFNTIRPLMQTYYNEKLRKKNSPRSDHIYPWIMLGCGVILMLVWPMIHTMALRNILLFTGGLIGFWYLIRERANLYQKQALPLLFMFLFFAWLGTHYFFFAQDLELELNQITSIWLRVLLAIFLGVGTGLFARHHQRAQHAIWASIFLFVVIFYIDYTWVSFNRNNWSIPYPFALGMYGNKISVVFYGIVAVALSCGMISYQLIQTKKNDNERNLFILIMLNCLYFFAFVIAGTKNGIALSLMLIFSLLTVFLTVAKKSFVNIFMASLLIGFICLASYLHLKLNPEWKNFLPTVATGLQIKEYPNWQNPDVYGLPKLPDGSEVPASAYLRIAFATEGLKLLLDNPWGYGSVEESFKYLAKADFPIGSNVNVVATHSGWLDFSLSLGIPGLLLTWTAIALALYYSYKQKTLWSYCTRWILAGGFLAWLFAEICSDHFLETLFYLIALLSAGNLPVITKIENEVTVI